MADALFNPGREGFLLAECAWVVPTVKVSLVRGYTFVATHKFVSDLTSITLVATQTLGTKAGTSGVASAANVTFPSVGAGAAITAIIIYQASAVGGGADVASSAQRVFAYIDSASGLPVTPNGGDIALAWDAGANKIFKL